MSGVRDSGRRVSFDSQNRLRSSEDAIMRAAAVAAEAAEAARMAAEAAARLGGGRIAQEAAAQAAAARGYRKQAADVARSSHEGGRPLGDLSNAPPGHNRSREYDEEGWDSDDDYEDGDGFYTQDERHNKTYLDGYKRQHRYSHKKDPHVPVASVKAKEFSFDGTHPAFADAHYVRTVEQDALLHRIKGTQKA
eukprot:CAMPEP_0182873068 /NCGR_PEP_ID=MMETSP0034_2-20130328/12097_1 /TAXON_ID=156128 /ORGANISM="Nephroselmis pyriformis, Strain CCMP717" /LENGTH=192 /DNA_ID=CAMNT_0025005693 /DNA_START=24 /DNA_END=598 /DNA_ORIENTATION=+